VLPTAVEHVYRIVVDSAATFDENIFVKTAVAVSNRKAESVAESIVNV
jgi:hypothetical protein